jgi:hypothetical protein
MKSYLVKLQLQIGEYEKSSTTVVDADNENDAGVMAQVLECHGNEHWENETVYDLGGEFAYRVRSVTELTPTDAKILKKHISHFQYNAYDVANSIDK